MNMGHDAMKAGDHMRMDTSAAKHLRGKATMPHPNEIARRLGKAIMREGSPGEEAGETVQQEAAEKRAGTEKPTKKRLPLPARKAA
jgi:hypothetical protein